jgi:lactoylglutathione lyase
LGEVQPVWMSVIGLHHAGLYVSSLERSIAFYRDTFALELAERVTFGGEEIAFLSMGSGRLELIEAAGSARPTGVIDHVALEVDDLDRTIDRLRQRGVKLLDAAPVAVPVLHARIFFCLGPDRERIELFARDG